MVGWSEIDICSEMKKVKNKTTNLPWDQGDKQVKICKEVKIPKN
jgi:hypothetical protein